jgi:hypothetical protein
MALSWNETKIKEKIEFLFELYEEYFAGKEPKLFQFAMFFNKSI